MPILQAEEALQERGPEMTADELYAAVLTATGDKAAAETAMQKRIEAQLRANQKPE